MSDIETSPDKRYCARMRNLGFNRIQIWVHATDREKLTDYAAHLRAHHMPSADPQPPKRRKARGVKP